MLSREHITKLLSLNGISPDAPDEEIKSLLLSAHWHEDDIETAVMVLRENKDTHETRVDTSRNVFSNEDRLNPETVSALLGVNMELSSEDIKQQVRYKQGAWPLSLVVTMLLVALMFAVGVVGFSMWYLRVGAFHQSVF